MKKEYIKPEIEIIEIKTDNTLLAASPAISSSTKTSFVFDNIIDDGDAGTAAAKGHSSIWDED